ncbi:hypothetical protein [Dyadobacter sp. 676]|uniref:ABC transporter permease n=1 Tax=Dyadobacter sp. 676 TaxID=3088362 RepID=A0AAU8FN44_9BACT
MNQTFNIHRLTLMLRFDAAEKGRNYLMMASLLLFGTGAMMFPVTLSTEFSPFLELLHHFALMMILLFGGSLYTSNAFSQFSDPSTGIASLMLPASKIEKFLSSLVLNWLFVVPFIAIFFQLHYLTFDIANAKLTQPGARYEYINRDVVTYVSFCYFLIQSSVFLGSIWFKKASYVKTAIIFVGISFLLCCANFVLASRLVIAASPGVMPAKVNAFPLSGWKIWFYNPDKSQNFLYNSTFYHVPFPDNLLLAVQIATAFVAAIFWVCAYFQLREREI